ncbi:adenosylmethionine-8-amino-7-oxononanoate aminotransferase [Streptomyces griseochromogenes]|uniref:Aminotransferase n=1 Tax=Streptomyces griseochromogenes TaxID=68214 RepID=A0A1B1AZQ7_9ACTN|nr:aminotransferase class III-fold pyridoxal phosphate-dependent enzyme [Streptomyces griseochromogenes]ANP52058.1 aminotransferase [Streptomyces griseochromogenes]MBP2056278.1 adenosylmethionine-8-amino-7-oxononanoate aminotransferase [Streptomyces griseochromogenes]
MHSSTSTSSLWRPWTPITQQANSLRIVEAQGTRVRDAEGKWYLDAISGVLNMSCGHGHPRLIEAANRQFEQLVHYDPMVSSHNPAETLASRLAETLPGELNEIVLLNSGSEATEAALRIALQYWRNIGEDRNRVITFEAAYHGTTYLAQQLSGLPFTASEWAPPFPIEHISLPAAPCEMRTEESADALIELFAKALETGPPAAAVMVEPLLGLGGCVVLPAGFLTRLRKLCDQHGALLILDEVFCGFGRTGRMFGFDHDGITPDIVTLSKGISGGYLPLAATAVTSTIKQTFVREPIAQGLRYGHTTGGHAVASAVANTVLDIMADEKLVENSAAQGATLLDGLQKLVESSPLVTDVRGLGLVIAVETDTEESAGAIAEAAAQAGVMTRHERGVIRIAPPLTLTADDTAELVGKITGAADTAAAAQR